MVAAATLHCISLLLTYVALRNLGGRIQCGPLAAKRVSKPLRLIIQTGRMTFASSATTFTTSLSCPPCGMRSVAMLVATAKVDVVVVSCPGLSSVARLVHTFIHTGSNFVPNSHVCLSGGFAVLHAHVGLVWPALVLAWLIHETGGPRCRGN